MECMEILGQTSTSENSKISSSCDPSLSTMHVLTSQCHIIGLLPWFFICTFNHSTLLIADLLFFIIAT